MAINSSAKYESQDKGTLIFWMHHGGPLRTANGKRVLYWQVREEISVTYMPHTKVVTPGVADDLRSQRLDTLMNLMLSPDIDHQSDSTKKYNQGKAKRTTIGFSRLCVSCLAMSMLCNNANLPTTTFGKDYDDGQRYTVPITKCGINETYDMNLK